MSSPNDLPPVRLGCVQYLNARPLIHGWAGSVRFDHPSALCRQLAEGELDIALVSSFELLRNPIYTVVDSVAVVSDGPVYSVFLAYEGSLEELREVVVDPASETSVNLLRVLFPLLQLVREGEMTRTRGALLIGDQAIAWRQRNDGKDQILDLGSEWKKRTELPFVYALWLIRPDYAEKRAMADALRLAAEKNLADLETIIAEEPAAARDFARFYFRESLRFTFGAREKEGLQKFAELCAKPFELNLV